MDGQNTQPAGQPQQQQDATPAIPGTPPAASIHQAPQEQAIVEEPRPRRATPPPPTPPPHDPPRSRVASSQGAPPSVVQGTPQGPQINVYPNTPSPHFAPGTQAATVSPYPQLVSTHPFPVNASLPANARPSGSRHSSGVARRSVGPLGEGVNIPHLSRSPSPILVTPAALDDAYSVSNHTHPGSSARPGVAIVTPDRPHTIAGYGPHGTLVSPTSQMPGAYDPPPGVPPGRSASMNMYAQGRENGSGFGAGGAPMGADMPRRPSRTVTRGRAQTQRSMTHSILDHNVPVLVEEDASTAGSGSQGERNVEARLAPTVAEAERQLRIYSTQATTSRYLLNGAIGLQLLLGALTTGVAAATSGRQTAIATTVLGGLSTLTASYLAKARSTGEPEASAQMAKELESFIRDCRAIQMDRGHHVGEKYDRIVQDLRHRFEEILGNRPRTFTDMVKEKIHSAMDGAQHADIGGRVENLGRAALVDVEKRGMGVVDRERGEWEERGVREWNQAVGRGAVAFDQAAARGMAAVEQRGQQYMGRM